MASFVFAQVTKIDEDLSGRMFQLMRTLVAAVVGMQLMFSQLKVEGSCYYCLVFYPQPKMLVNCVNSSIIIRQK